MLTDEDDLPVELCGKPLVVVARCWVEAPEQDAQGDVDRFWNYAVPTAQLLAAGVDKQCAMLKRRRGVSGRQSIETGSRIAKKVADGPAHHGEIVRPRVKRSVDASRTCARAPPALSTPREGARLGWRKQREGRTASPSDVA